MVTCLTALQSPYVKCNTWYVNCKLFTMFSFVYITRKLVLVLGFPSSKLGQLIGLTHQSWSVSRPNS